ncbi:MAG: hypothetical protein AAGK78_11685, partial [Planctomycetota bacterium]
MADTTINDPTLGELTWQGFLHGGWVRPTKDERLADWGERVPLFGKVAGDEDGDDEEDGDVFEGFKTGNAEVDAAIESGSVDALTEAIVNTDPMLAGADDKQKKWVGDMIGMMKEMSESLEEDDELETDPLRERGLHKLVVRGNKDEPIAEAQQQVFQKFVDSGDAMVEVVLGHLFEIYQRQFARRRDAWAAMYGDDSSFLLPKVEQPADLKPLFWLTEVLVMNPADDFCPLALIFESSFDHRGVGLVLRGDKLIGSGDMSFVKDRDSIVHWRPAEAEKVDPTLGKLTKDLGDWTGTYHTALLHGRIGAGATKARFDPDEPTPFRESDSWEALDNAYPITLGTGKDDVVHASVAERFAAFMADQEANERKVL